MKRFLKIIKNKDGTSYIDTIILIFVIAMILALFIKVIPVFILKSNLNTFATNISKIISVEGRYDTEVKNKIKEYQNANHLDDVVINMDETVFINGTDKIQLNDKIVVKVQLKYDLGFFQFGKFEVTLNNKAIERSDVYWK